jgi:hypothetical protein
VGAWIFVKTEVIFLSWVCFGVVLHHLPDDLPLIAISGQWKPYYPCVNIAIAVCSSFDCALKTCVLSFLS